jgi:hypothetical protein
MGMARVKERVDLPEVEEKRVERREGASGGLCWGTCRVEGTEREI